MSSSPGSPGSVPGGGGGGGSSQASNGGNGAAGQVVVTYTPSSTPSTNVMRFLLDVPGSGGVDGAILCRMLTAGTVAKADVIYHTGGNLELIGYNGGGSSIFDSGSHSFSANGTPMMVSVELTTSGGNVAWKLTAIQPGAGSVIASFNGTVAGSVGGVNTVVVNPGGTDTGATVVGHVTIQYALVDLTLVSNAINGYIGERAGTRFTRVLGEEGYTATLNGNASDTPLMGAQVNDTLVSIVQGVEDLDRGLLFEQRNSFGLGYRTRVSMQNQVAAVTLDYSANQLADGLAPTYDDQLTRNIITGSRVNGSSATKSLMSGSMSTQQPPNGVGPYPASLSVRANADSQLANLVSWMLSVGTVDEERYPVISVNLVQPEVATILDTAPVTFIGDFLKIINAPVWLPNSTIKQLVYGYSEVINAFTWRINFNCVPESVYEGGGLPTW